MEALTVFVGMALRLALPVALLFWISARLRAWDEKEMHHGEPH